MWHNPWCMVMLIWQNSGSRAMANYFLKILSIGFFILFLSGCYSLGPNEIKGTHPLYNQAVINTIDEQFLTNLVRLKYRDNPYFLDVSNIVTSVRVEASGGLSGSQVSLDNVASNFARFDAGGAYSATPTITFQPVEGENFVRKFLAPVSMDNLIILAQTGWSLKRLFGLCIEQINGLSNAKTASGPTPGVPPNQYEEFNQALDLMEELRADESLSFTVDPIDKVVKMDFQTTPESAGMASELKSLLRLDPRSNSFQVHTDLVHQSPNSVSLRIRSPLSVLFYLSQNIQAPVEHEKMGLVTVTRYPDGAQFNWSDTAAGRTFKILSSEDKPERAYAAIPYRDHWFYLDDADLETKSTFMLMSQIFRLQAGSIPTAAPVLTIPVAR